jgi:hypothetical protein
MARWPGFFQPKNPDPSHGRNRSAQPEGRTDIIPWPEFALHIPEFRRPAKTCDQPRLARGIVVQSALLFDIVNARFGRRPVRARTRNADPTQTGKSCTQIPHNSTRSSAESA